MTLEMKLKEREEIGRAEGIAKGRAEGRAEGIAKGRAEELNRNAKKVAELLNITKEEALKILNSRT